MTYGEPGLLGRLVARLSGEVAATALEAYHRAGRSVYELLDRLEQRDMEATFVAGDAHALPRSLQAAKLCGWNAFALQIIGDELLDHEYRARPLTVGYVNPVTAAQALACYGQVARWVSRSQQALQDEAYELDVAVPAPLPPWPDVEEYPEAHLAGLRSALDRLRRHAEAAVWESRLDGAWGGDERVGGQVGRLLAEAGAADDYSDGLAAGDGAEDAAVAKEIADQVHTGLERYYLLGQIVAMPRLALNPFPALQAGSSRRPGRPPRLPRPGESGFDPWCLTDPRIVGALRRDRRARRTIDELWERDPDANRTLAIKAEIDGALIRHDIAYEAGHFNRCPWGPIYLVKQPVRIAQRPLRPLEEFTYDVVVEPRGKGWAVRREIVVGPFYPTG